MNKQTIVGPMANIKEANGSHKELEATGERLEKVRTEIGKVIFWTTKLSKWR